MSELPGMHFFLSIIEVVSTAGPSRLGPVRCLCPRIPANMNGGVGQNGRSVQLEAKIPLVSRSSDRSKGTAFVVRAFIASSVFVGR
jgi:hypothetical protein